MVRGAKLQKMHKSGRIILVEKVEYYIYRHTRLSQLEWWIPKPFHNNKTQDNKYKNISTCVVAELKWQPSLTHPRDIQ